MSTINTAVHASGASPASVKSGDESLHSAQTGSFSGHQVQRSNHPVSPSGLEGLNLNSIEKEFYNIQVAKKPSLAGSAVRSIGKLFQALGSKVASFITGRIEAFQAWRQARACGAAPASLSYSHPPRANSLKSHDEMIAQAYAFQARIDQAGTAAKETIRSGRELQTKIAKNDTQKAISYAAKRLTGRGLTDAKRLPNSSGGAVSQESMASNLKKIAKNAIKLAKLSNHGSSISMDHVEKAIDDCFADLELHKPTTNAAKKLTQDNLEVGEAACREASRSKSNVNVNEPDVPTLMYYIMGKMKSTVGSA